MTKKTPKIKARGFLNSFDDDTWKLDALIQKFETLKTTTKQKKRIAVPTFSKTNKTKWKSNWLINLIKAEKFLYNYIYVKWG